MKKLLASVALVSTLAASTAKAGIMILIGSIGVTGASSTVIGILLIVLGGPVGIVISEDTVANKINQQIAASYSFLDKDTRDAIAELAVDTYVNQRDEQGNACVILEEESVRAVLGDGFSTEQVETIVADLTSDC